MDALTKIEIAFAQLRDRLYVERSEEVGKENTMILDGTHPELIHLTALIEARRQVRLHTVQLQFEEEQRHFAKMAAAEEREAWMTWRYNVAELRRGSMEEISRKRRKLEREKRNLDAPRPIRRPQHFEGEYIGDPDLGVAAVQAAKADKEPGLAGRRRAVREARDLAKLGSYIAVPDLRGSDSYETFQDLSAMGLLQPDPRMMNGGVSHASSPPPPQQVPYPTQMAPPMAPGPSDLNYYAGQSGAPTGPGPDLRANWGPEPPMSGMYGPGPGPPSTPFPTLVDG